MRLQKSLRNVHTKVGWWLQWVQVACGWSNLTCVFVSISPAPPCVLLTVRVNDVEGGAVLGEADCEESARGCQQQQQLTEQKSRSLAHGCSQTTLPVTHWWRCYLETPEKHAFCYFTRNIFALLLQAVQLSKNVFSW